MDPVFGAPQWIRTWLSTNKIPMRQEFNPPMKRAKGGLELPRTHAWSRPGRGVQGESTNSSSNNDKQVIRKTYRPSTP